LESVVAIPLATELNREVGVLENSSRFIAVRVATNVTAWRSEGNLFAPTGVASELSGWTY
jgi:hypothetical protein